MVDLLLFQATLQDLCRPKRVLTAGALALLPGLIALIWRLQGSTRSTSPAVIYNILSSNLVFGVVLVLLAVVFGIGVISQEIEQKTIPYLLTRPVPRWRIVLVKFAAALAVVLGASWISCLVLALCACAPHSFDRAPLGRDLLILPVGALAYGSLFLALATLLNRPLLLGLLFAFGWESWAPTLPGSFAKVSLMSYLRVLAPHPQPQSDSVDLKEMLLSFQNPAAISHSMAWWVLSLVTVCCLLLALAVFSVKEYVPKEDLD